MKAKLEDLSHSVRGIAQICGLILIFGISICGVISMHLANRNAENSEQDAISDIYTRFVFLDFPEAVPEGGFDDELPLELESLFLGAEEEWLPDLKAAAAMETPSEGALFALGLWHVRDQDRSTALDLLQRENDLYPHPLVRSLVVDTALALGNTDVLDALASDPDYAEEVDSLFQVQRGLQEGDWKRVLHYYLSSEYENLSMAALWMALIAGAVWAALLLSLHSRTLRPSFLVLSLLALALGWISTWPTVLSLMWMDEAFGFTEGNDFFSTLFYMIVSVGVREEICKLLLFSPLLLFTVRRGQDMEALLLGALVGLGFAIEENIRYFASGFDGVAVSRFVSANLLHFTLTGATALGLHRAVRDPERWTLDALQVLVFAIGLHGLYNALLSHPVPGLGDMSYFSGSALAGCAYLFFREVEGIAPLRDRRLTRSALFCWGFCILFCLELGMAVTQASFPNALAFTGQAALAGVFTGYIFLHYVRERLNP